MAKPRFAEINVTYSNPPGENGVCVLTIARREGAPPSSMNEMLSLMSWFPHPKQRQFCKSRSAIMTFSRPFKSGAWRNGTSFGLHDLEALMNVTLEAKEWIAAHALKR